MVLSHQRHDQHRANAAGAQQLPGRFMLIGSLTVVDLERLPLLNRELERRDLGERREVERRDLRGILACDRADAATVIE